jgi:glycogen debranching enzyme
MSVESESYTLSGMEQLRRDALSRLNSLKAPEKSGVFTSGGTGFEYAIFGRDSIEAAEDLMDVKPELTKEILEMMARLQGTELNHQNEEELGKIHHEYRVRRLGDLAVSKSAMTTIEKLGPKWGGTREKLLYYGSVDSTPLFVRLACNYIEKHGDSILESQVVNDKNQLVEFSDCLRSASKWVLDSVNSSDWGLLEFKRLNPVGLSYQAWKDSESAYLHENGDKADPDMGIASVEVQGYAYDALKFASKLDIFTDDEVKSMRQAAQKVQKNTIDYLWMDDRGFFAMGLDRSDRSHLSQIKTHASNAGTLLDSDLLRDLPVEKSKLYTSAIVKKIMGDEFMTDAGVRSRSLNYADMYDEFGYHGSFVSWPKDTYDIAKGMRKHGYVDEADRLDKVLLDIASRSKDFYEVYFVDKDGTTFYDYTDPAVVETMMSHGVTHIPEPGQAWTVTAILEISSRMKNKQN